MTATIHPTTMSATAADLRMVVLLAGRVGPHPLAAGIGRSVLDLPVSRDRRLLSLWVDRLAELASELDAPDLRVRIAVHADGESPARIGGDAGGRLQIDVIRDASDYRGTAGVVRDLTQDLPDSSLVLVVAAHQLQNESLTRWVPDLVRHGEGVILARHGASDFASAFLLRRERLLAVPAVGFMDLKEQAIPEFAGGRALHVALRPHGANLPIRTLREYIDALRAVHSPGGVAAAGPRGDEAFQEVWEPRFAIVEDGADVAASAVIMDSVVLAGGRVEPGAVVARSVVCPNGVVRRDRSVVDEVVVA